MRPEKLGEIKNKIYPILKRYGVAKASIFGSYVREEETIESDIDILVEFSSEKSLLDLAGLKIELEEALARKVDVLTYKSLHPLIKDGILKEQEVLI
ncbi:MAG: nucleotidyltransferase family protein [Candidatus Omnitrophica bacterium]|nr:nucleotidyltransferase family protein [Candidatus Omnitrophota bacterium]